MVTSEMATLVQSASSLFLPSADNDFPSVCSLMTLSLPSAPGRLGMTVSICAMAASDSFTTVQELSILGRICFQFGYLPSISLVTNCHCLLCRQMCLMSVGSLPG